jgi:hypothetical protein
MKTKIKYFREDLGQGIVIWMKKNDIWYNRYENENTFFKVYSVRDYVEYPANHMKEITVKEAFIELL